MWFSATERSILFKNREKDMMVLMYIDAKKVSIYIIILQKKDASILVCCMLNVVSLLYT